MSRIVTYVQEFDKTGLSRHPDPMNQGEAFVLALLLLVGTTVIARKYLSRDAQVVLMAIAAAAHLA